ncbi:MAG TPA: putative RNA uridine N3 methyltransferase [Nitrososphaerales archaeon]|nr:putative RNA uridine N3 methyltransferase [Nitrososphaerales archaeon]
MTLRGRRLGVSIPDTVLEEKDSLREKTTKLGAIARSCAIYGVDVVEVFRDRGGRGEAALIRRVLEYLETPQYLRKRLFPLDESLHYAGILPPLRIPSHRVKVPVEELELGEVREGVVNADGTVDVGLDEAPWLKGGAESGRRATVKIVSKSPLTAQAIPRDEVEEYWGYRVETRSFDEVFTDRRFSLKIATSRLGDRLESKVDALRERVASADGVKLVFGSPARGLFDMAGASLAKRADFVVNLFAEQHVETVRTEEAVFAGLALVGTLSAEKA